MFRSVSHSLSPRHGTALSLHLRGFSRLLMILVILGILFSLSPAAHADEDLLWELPGDWTYTADYEEGRVDLAILTLHPDGDMVLRSLGDDGETSWTCEGTWSLELNDGTDPERGYNDWLTLLFTSTDNPAHTESEYNIECVYAVYAESWVDGVTRYTVLIDAGAECSSLSPFEELCEEEGAALMHREEGPNYVVVKCQRSVSLREERSKKSVCLKKVPLGASVFVFPEDQEENGFVRCVYDGEYGYILSAYLQPVD